MLLNHHIAVRQHINWQSIQKLMRVSFEHLVTHLSRLPQLPFKGIPLWKTLTCIIFDRQTRIWEGCGQLLRFYRGKKCRRKKNIYSLIHLIIINFSVKNLWESYLSIFSTTEIDAAAWIKHQNATAWEKDSGQCMWTHTREGYRSWASIRENNSDCSSSCIIFSQ